MAKQVDNVMALVAKPPVVIVTGKYAGARELAAEHGLELGEWWHADTTDKMNGMKGNEIMFGRGYEVVPELYEIVEVAKLRDMKVVHGDWPVVAAPGAAPGKTDRRLKANRVPGAKTSAQAIRVKYVLSGDTLGKYRFMTPAAEAVGQFDHAQTLEEIVEKVKIAYAPRIFLEEVE